MTDRWVLQNGITEATKISYYAMVLTIPETGPIVNKKLIGFDQISDGSGKPNILCSKKELTPISSF
jgi:hypothetical protein